MELSIPASKIDAQNVFFMEKKKNVIVDGEFVKILYSTPAFEMSGLYIFAEFTDIFQRSKNEGVSKKTTHPHPPSYQKKYIMFNPSTIENTYLIHLLCQIESSIIGRYIQEHCPSKIASYTLKSQLINGIIKYHSDHRMIHLGQPSIAAEKERIILKIAGIWETAIYVGITMKFISASE